MRIQILKQVLISGRVANVGEIVEVSPSDATYLASYGAAVASEAPEIEPKEAPVECPMPTSEAKPKTSRRKPKS